MKPPRKTMETWLTGRPFRKVIIFRDTQNCIVVIAIIIIVTITTVMLLSGGEEGASFSCRQETDKG